MELIEGDDDFEIIGDTTKENFEQSSDDIGTEVSKPFWAIFVMLVFAVIVANFWAESGHLFLSQYFHRGNTPTWKVSILYSAVVTFIFAIVLWLSGFFKE